MQISNEQYFANLVTLIQNIQIFGYCKCCKIGVIYETKSNIILTIKSTKREAKFKLQKYDKID